MEANTFVFHHWDDVVFENRNKAYGAYLLRRAYAQRLLSGVGITLIMVALILSLQNIFSDTGKPPVISLPSSERVIDLFPQPFVEQKQAPQRPVQELKTNAQNRPVLVTTEQVEQSVVEEVQEFVSGDGVETGVVGTLEGTGTTPVIESVPVVLPKIVDFAEVMPQYEGGIEAMMKFIQKKIRFPVTPRRLNIDGTVFVRFVVNGDGSVTDVEVIKGVHPDYDKEVIRVISMLPAWIGGSHNGMPVSVRMVLPIKFNLKE